MLDDFPQLTELKVSDLVFERTREVMLTHLPILGLESIGNRLAVKNDGLVYRSLSHRG